jgi:hypothetical protein
MKEERHQVRKRKPGRKERMQQAAREMEREGNK